MKKKEAADWLRAILEDMPRVYVMRYPKRVEAIKKAIAALGGTATMTKEKAAWWLQDMLVDTFNGRYERDKERIQAIKKGIAALERK